MHVDLGPAAEFLLPEILVDGVGGHRGLTDGGGQQMRTDDVASDEVPGPVGDLMELVGIDEAAAIVHDLKTGKIPTLADGGDDQVGLQDALGALDGDGTPYRPSCSQQTLSPVARPSAFLMRPERHDAIQNGDALGQGIMDLMLGGGHLVAGEERGQGDLRALGRRADGGVMGHITIVDDRFGEVGGLGVL